MRCALFVREEGPLRSQASPEGRLHKRVRLRELRESPHLVAVIGQFDIGKAVAQLMSGHVRIVPPPRELDVVSTFVSPVVSTAYHLVSPMPTT